MIYIHAGEKATEEAVQFFVHVYLLSINGLTSSLIRRRRQGMNLSFVKLRRLVIDMKMISCHHNHATLFCTLLPVRVINFTVSYCTKKSVHRRQLQTFSSYVKQLLYEQFETIYSTWERDRDIKNIRLRRIGMKNQPLTCFALFWECV